MAVLDSLFTLFMLSRFLLWFTGPNPHKLDHHLPVASSLSVILEHWADRVDKCLPYGQYHVRYRGTSRVTTFEFNLLGYAQFC